MLNINEKVEDLKNNGYSLDISNMIKQSIDIYKKYFGFFFGFFIVTIIINLIFSAITRYIPFGIGNIGGSLIQMPLSLGFYYVMHRIKNNREISFENFFDGFKDFLKIVISSLIMAAIILPFLIPPIIYIIYKVYNGLDLSGLNDPLFMKEFFTSMEFMKLFFISFLLSIGAIYIGFCLQFALLLVLFLDVEYIDAMKWSFQIVNKKLFSIFAFDFIMLLIGMTGIILCGIGILVTIPVVIISKYILFYEVFDVRNLDHSMRDKIHDYLEDEPSKDEMFR